MGLFGKNVTKHGHVACRILQTAINDGQLLEIWSLGEGPPRNFRTKSCKFSQGDL